jgi:hypothetical protein
MKEVLSTAVQQYSALQQNFDDLSSQFQEDAAMSDAIQELFNWLHTAEMLLSSTCSTSSTTSTSLDEINLKLWTIEAKLGDNPVRIGDIIINSLDDVIDYVESHASGLLFLPSLSPLLMSMLNIRNPLLPIWKMMQSVVIAVWSIASSSLNCSI